MTSVLYNINHQYFLIHAAHGGVDGDRGLALGLPPLRLGLDLGLAILVHLELGDDEVGGGDPDRDLCSVDLLARDAFDVDDHLLPETRRDFALPGLVHAPHDEDLVVLAYGHTPDPEPSLQLLR